MIHIAEAWKRSNALTRTLAGRYPAATITCIRDIYGRCSFAVERASAEELSAISALVTDQAELAPYLGRLGVQLLEDGSSLAGLVQTVRRPLGDTANAFVIERLLSNESWTRAADHNPTEFPKVVAFYSFKGGVGRTTTTAMTGLTLAREGKRVIIIDLDLEAPGIEGYFFGPEDSSGTSAAGIVDYLLEHALLGADYAPDMNDFVLPYSDAAIAASGGSLLVVSAGSLDDTYMERLGRINLADIGRQRGDKNPLRALIQDLVRWRPADIVLVDCRTGFTDLGGVTLNGLSNLDVLVFRGGEADRRYLPLVLQNIQRFRQPQERSLQVAEQLARSFLIVYTMVELPAQTDEAEQYIATLRSDTGEACWKHVFGQFSGLGYVYPSSSAQDSPLEPVPHDVVLIPYLKDFFSTRSVSDMLRLQAERPERPYDTLVRRLLDTKLTERLVAPPVESASAPARLPTSDRDEALAALRDLTGSPAGEDEFASPADFQRRFLPRTAYRALLDPRAFLILGRKGAGKSALFQILTHDLVARALAAQLQLDASLVEKTRWEVGFSSAGRDFPASEDFLRLLTVSEEDPDLLVRFWRSLAAWRLSVAFPPGIAGLASAQDCLAKLRDDTLQDAVRSWLEQLDRRLAHEGRFCCLSYDDLDTGLTRDGRKRGLLVSALIELWQQSIKRLPRLRGKIFLREDIWNLEVGDVTDKSKVRDGIDRATITWDGPDIYRAILKRLGPSPAFQALCRQQGLWQPAFDELLTQPLGFVPPEDEDWLRKCIHLVAGEAMAPGPKGFKKGYVYQWILNHTKDATDQLRPRNALLLFSEAAKLQGRPEPTGALLRPWRFMDALRGEVSRAAVADLRAEFKHEWSAGDTWLPDLFARFERIWPVPEQGLETFLQQTAHVDHSTVQEKLTRMREAGLLEHRTLRGRAPQFQIPDLYLFGLGLTRRG